MHAAATVAPAMRCLYVDLGGTLLGPGGSLLRAADGGFALDGVRALQACARAAAEVVLYSGRRQSSVFEDARLIGQDSYIFELGCGLVVDGELEWLTDGVEPSEEAGTIYEQITASGAPALLLERFAGSLEYHTPWSAGRDVSHLFRGSVDLAEANAGLADAGFGWLRVVDNGVLAAHGVAIDGGALGLGHGRVHAYHLIPATASKARAVARHMQNRGYEASDCIAVGDSREDMDAASVVGRFWLVANGAGVYEAVVTTLAER
jgi:phosphoglycolate phosphatase